jgi:hypothetical protein
VRRRFVCAQVLLANAQVLFARRELGVELLQQVEARLMRW